MRHNPLPEEIILPANAGRRTGVGAFGGSRRSAINPGPAPQPIQPGKGPSLGGGGGGAGTPPDLPVSDIVRAYMDLGLSYEEASYLVAEDPQKALEYLYDLEAGTAGGGGGGGADNTVGMANNALGYAGLEQDDRHFYASQAQQGDQFNRSLAQGAHEFEATHSRNAYESDRAYEQAKYEYSTSFAENQRQFDLGYGLDNRSLDLQTELGRGNLALGQGRLGLDTELGRGELALGRDRLGLDTELGRGRLALDTELGRGGLEVDRGHLGVARGRLAMDDRLGTGRLNLDTELGRGQLGVNQQAEQRLQRGQVAGERLANRDQELQRTQFVTDVLRKPSDFLARAFLQRGGTSPTGMVSQADIINNLKSSINQFSQGGATTDEVFTTGEQGGAESTEMLFNPTGAPITILNPDQTQQVMGGDVPQYDKGTLGKQGAKKTGGIIGRLQDVLDEIEGMGSGVIFNADVKLDTDQVDDQRNSKDPLKRNKKKGKITLDPELLKMLLKSQSDEMESEIGRLGGTGRAKAAMEVPGYANGTLPGYNPGAMQMGSTPDWDAAYNSTTSTINRMRLPDVNQQDLINTGLGALPPAAAAALHGRAGAIPSARPAGNLTLGRIARLAPGEQEALNTQLGIQYNTDLENEIAMLQERFGPVVNRQRGRLIPQ